MPSQDSSKDYQPVKPNYLKRHVSNLLVIVPVEDQNEINLENDEKELDAEDVHDGIENESNVVEDKEVNNDRSNDEKEIDD